MRYLKTAFALGAGVALVGAWACGGSSSSPSSPGGDGGNGDATADLNTDDGGTEDADASDAATCNPTSPDNACATGMVCCFDPMSALSGGIAALASGFKGNCTEPSACMASVSVQCLTAAGCAAGQVCCLAGNLGGGGDAGAAAGGLGGLGALTSFSATSTCQQTCPAGQMQACAQTSDCKGSNAGLVCSPLGLGALGGAAGGMFSGILGGLATEMVCSPPDGGAPDGGATDSGGLDAGAPDAGVPDAGPTVDAGSADAPTSDGI